MLEFHSQSSAPSARIHTLARVCVCMLQNMMYNFVENARRKAMHEEGMEVWQGQTDKKDDQRTDEQQSASSNEKKLIKLAY